MSNPIEISLDLSQRQNLSPYSVYVWCAEQFGTECILWRRVVGGLCPRYAFINEKDAAFFALRWK